MKKIKTGFFYKLGFLLMGIGVLLRLGTMFLSFDFEETYSVITSNPNLPLGQIVKDWLIVDVHPPLFNILLWGWNHLVPYPHEVCCFRKPMAKRPVFCFWVAWQLCGTISFSALMLVRMCFCY